MVQSQLQINGFLYQLINVTFKIKNVRYFELNLLFKYIN